MSIIRTLLAVPVLFAGLLSTQPAFADLVLGQKIYYTGGEVHIEVLAASAGYHSFLGLYMLDPTTQQGGDIAENHDTGTMVTIDPAALGYLPGDELIFGIRVYSGGDHTGSGSLVGYFFTGDASRNPDNILHAGVDSLGGGLYEVGFEDLMGGGDLDYNDNRFLFSGGVSVPEPGVILLLGLGLLGIGVRRYV